MKTINDISLQDKRVLIREDFNVPLESGHIRNDARIRAALPTIEAVFSQGAQSILLMSHLGRPKEGLFEKSLSLLPVAKHLEELTGRKVHFFTSIEDVEPLPNGALGLIENIRFCKGEKNNDETLARQLAGLCDVFVMDAFGAAHRAHASTYGVAEYAPQVCAGLLLEKEVNALTQVLEAPKRPLVAIIGGAKVSSKLAVLGSLLDTVDYLIVGGGMANTFLAARGFSVGASLMEPDLIDSAKDLLRKAEENNKQIILPSDVVVATDLSESAMTRVVSIDEIRVDEAIFDVGPKSITEINTCIKEAGTILWNGPLGVFECQPFSAGTAALTEAVKSAKGFSFAGGGDTLAAIAQFSAESGIDYISTGGGAFLEWVEEGSLPCVDIIREKS
ncbi:MAG: phosphoglycerate kinase [Legionellales bacterium]|nr:phosphoglycerate kinase [Legionellales bacterium]